MFSVLSAGFVDKLSKTEHEELVEAFATWLYLTAIPFWIVEQQVRQICIPCQVHQTDALLSAAFTAVQATINFFQKLRPAFKLPDRRALSCGILLTVFIKVQQAVRDVIGDRPLALTSDGWSRKQGDVHVVNFCGVQPGAAFFMDMALCHGDKLGGNGVMQKHVCRLARICQCRSRHDLPATTGWLAASLPTRALCRVL